LPAQNFDRLVGNRNSLPDVIDSCPFKVCVQLSDVTDDGRPNDPALKLRFRLNQATEHFPNRVTADQCFAGTSDEARFWFVQRHDCIEVTGVEMLHELTRPILRLMR
jgi:hypothetical protein